MNNPSIPAPWRHPNVRRELERFVAAYDVAPQPKGAPWMRSDDE